MKKVFVTFAAIYAMSAYNPVKAQIAATYKNQVTSIPSYNNDPAHADGPADASSVSPIALKDFKKKVTATVDEKWETTADGFVAYYSKDAVLNKMVYDKKGKWKFTVLDYKRDGLEPVLRDAIEYVYEGTVFSVNEIHTTYKKVYLVRVTDNATYKTIRIIDGEMELIEELRK
jgi:hypothetical protein